MSKRLQIVLPDDQYREVAEVARRRGVTVAEWVRRLLRTACRRAPSGVADRKAAAVRAAYEHAFPVADIDVMLGEIESGHESMDG